MTPCPFCQQQPVVHRHDAAAKNAAWYQIECQSKTCENRVVKTHRLATEAQALSAWDDRVASGEAPRTVTIKGRAVELSKAEADTLAVELAAKVGVM